MKKVIVTGANGFIGTAVIKELFKKGYEVTSIIKDENEDISQISSLSKIVYCDLSEFPSLSGKIRHDDYDAFIHFAWIGSAGIARGDYVLQLNNSKYSCDAVHVAHNVGCRKFIIASSIMQYEAIASINNSISLGVNSIYSIAKFTATHLTRIIANSLNIGHISAVISNVYGIGENSPRLINTLIKKLLAGEHVPVTEGNQMYDFIYIDDAAKAFCCMVDAGKSGKDYYIGSGKPKPLKLFLEQLQQIVAPTVALGFGEVPFDGVSLDYNSLFDIKALNRDTGFVCDVPFSLGVEKTAEWLKQGEIK